MPAETLGAYQLESRLGTGGMGTVYLARRQGEEDAPRVALKVLHPHLVEKPGFFKRFLREAKIGMEVRHENVVQTLDVDAVVEGGEQINFLVMEYVEGKTLRELLEELGTIPEALLREIARQAAAGLTAIHDVGAVHRDLKPDNLLVTDSHEVRIMDLGIARVVDEARLTAKGEFAGSLQYAAPEQFGPAGAGPEADLYSLGVLLYELAVGENPFNWEETARIISAHMVEMPVPPGERNGDVSEFLSEVILTLLAKEPGARFSSAAALEEVLAEGEDAPWWAERRVELRKAAPRMPRIQVRRETRLRGREDDLAALRDSYERAKSGEGNMILIEGEAGIGKTRLVDEFLRGLAGEDAHFLYGSYPPTGGPGGLSEAILEHFGTSGIDERLAPYLCVTPSLVPAFAAYVRHEGPPPGAAPLAEGALHALMSQLVRSLSLEKPLIWVVDDLHFAKPDGRDIVLAMARALSGHPALLIGTSRPGLPEVELGHLGRIESFRRIALDRLGAREVIELLVDAFRSEGLALKLGGQISLKSDGVPFFVFEMIRGLKEGQFITELPDGTHVETRVVESIEVPSVVRDLVDARLRELSDEDRELLDVAAVEGFEFDPALAADLCGMRRFQVLRRLAAIERRSGVIRSGPNKYRFDHHQIQEVLYGDVPPQLRSEYHSLLAEAFARRHGTENRRPEDLPGETAVFLASHHVKGNRPPEALPYLGPALDYLAHSFRNDVALELAEDALRREGLLTGGERVEILLRKAGRLGFLGRKDDERAALDEALEIAEGEGDVRQRAKVRRFLANYLWHTGRHEDAREQAHETIRLAREADDRTSEMVAENVLGLVAKDSGRYDEARLHAERALGMAQATGDERRAKSAEINLAAALTRLGERDGAREHLERVLFVARKLGDRRTEALAHGNLGILAAGLGQDREAREHYIRYAELCRETGYRRGEATARMNLGNVLARADRPSEALEAYDRALSVSREIDSGYDECLVQVNAGHLFLRIGGNPEARARFELAHALARERGYQVFEGYALEGFALVAEQEGDLEAARLLLEDLLSRRRFQSDSVSLLSPLLHLGRILGGKPDDARPLLEEALSISREGDHTGHEVIALARLATLDRERTAEALERFEEHEDRLSAGMRMEARIVLAEATGDPSHRDEAVRLLEHLKKHTPEGFRTKVVESVPLHRELSLPRASREKRASPDAGPGPRPA